MAGPYYTNNKVDGTDNMAEVDLEAIETGFASVDTDLQAIVPGTQFNLLAADPATPAQGDYWFNTTDLVVRYCEQVNGAVYTIKTVATV